MLWVNVADTPHKQAQGLMFVKEMSDDNGMLFKFPNSQMLSFWGQNTYIPLDIAFVNSDGVIVDIKEIEPHSLKSVSSNKPCCMAIEANIDYFHNNKINIGDVVEIKEDPHDGTFVSFSKVKTAQKSQTEQISVEEAENLPYTQDEVAFQEEPEYSLEQQQEEAWQYMQDQEEIQQGWNANPYGNEMQEEIEGLVSTEDIMSVDDEVKYQTLTEDGFVDIDKVVDKPEPPEEDYPEFYDPFQFLSWAMDNGQVVWIDYDTKSGVNVQRNIVPLDSYVSEKGNLNIVTFDETVNAYRSFIIKRIKDFEFLGRTFEKEKFQSLTN